MSNGNALRTCDEDAGVQAMRRCVQHVNAWLAAADTTYGQAARTDFVRAHPVLFGHAYEIALRGYERWHRRHGLCDSSETFARYVTPRHDRWLNSMGCAAGAVAPCLLGAGQTRPCWSAVERLR
jgi:hypothetical protein